MKRRRVKSAKAAYRQTFRQSNAQVKIITRRDGRVELCGITHSKVYGGRHKHFGSCNKHCISHRVQLTHQQLRQALDWLDMPPSQESVLPVYWDILNLTDQASLGLFRTTSNGYSLVNLRVGQTEVGLTRAAIKQIKYQLEGVCLPLSV